MKKIIASSAIFGVVAIMSMSSVVIDLCHGFLPENDMKIPVQLQMLQGGGVSEEEFHMALDRIEAHYAPIIEELGGVFEISRQWTNDTVNASAQRLGSTYRINMFGGLARHPEMNSDGFLLVACHEVGHHIGGAPKYGGWFGGWATNEGQADYFSGLRCLRAIWTDEENAEFVANTEVDEFLAETCVQTWELEAEQNLCIRIASAGMITANLFRSMREEEVAPHYSTPDPKRVTKTSHSHPATQCRLDTYFQSGLCVHDVSEELSNEDVRIGTCTESAAYEIGTRPRCWYGEEY